jgi:hypothetical protein
MRLDFVVMGLPRSGTTWLANLLTTHQSLCLHDPFATMLPEDIRGDGRRLGVSCTGLYLMPRLLATQHCPMAVIERPVSACDASTEKLGLGSVAPLKGALDRVQARRFAFEDLWEEYHARRLWIHLLPGLPWDAPRYRLLRDMRIEPLHPQKLNLDVAKELADRGLFVMEDDSCLGA